MDQENHSSPLADARLCVITPYYPTVSETFIRGHVERLPARTLLIHGWPPAVGGSPVLSWPTRAGYRLYKKLSRKNPTDETTAAYLVAFRRFRPDLVLAEYGPTAVAVMPACRKLNLPLVAHFHGYDASIREVLRENADIYPKLFRQSAAIIAVSRAMERKLISLGAPAGKVHYNPYGVDCHDFFGGDPASAAPSFLAVGRFVEKKAPALTIRAFAIANAAYPDIRLRMIGDGPLLDECRELTKELRLEHAIAFLGAQPQSVVQHEMRNARAFVQHSVIAPNGDSEGTPVGILEAGAAGLPVVSTRHAGIPDVVIEGETGLLVDEGDIESMAAHMLLLAGEPAVAARLGQAARRHIETSFSSEHRIGRLAEILQSCVIAHTNLEVEPGLAPQLGLS